MSSRSRQKRSWGHLQQQQQQQQQYWEYQHSSFRSSIVNRTRDRHCTLLPREQAVVCNFYCATCCMLWPCVHRLSVTSRCSIKNSTKVPFVRNVYLEFLHKLQKLKQTMVDARRQLSQTCRQNVVAQGLQLANVNSRSRSLYAIARPSVCRL